ncbi:hypothetical protein [Bacillus testis]|uniref:hypothetical protein n=1 Tax=Bacillus testis TaxID=1622072 RepID=UPI0012B50799|nr:hypothetical protein [Bacillus testis]
MLVNGHHENGTPKKKRAIWHRIAEEIGTVLLYLIGFSLVIAAVYFIFVWL